LFVRFYWLCHSPCLYPMQIDEATRSSVRLMKRWWRLKPKLATAPSVDMPTEATRLGATVEVSWKRQNYSFFINFPLCCLSSVLLFSQYSPTDLTSGCQSSLSP
jgi:hypothetical protein